MNDLAASRTFKMVAGTLALVDEASASSTNASAFSTENILDAGTVVDGKFQILSVIGQGGMGAVYRAYHLTLNKDIALKTFYSTDVDDQNWQRFLQEARLIAKLQDPHIVQVFDYGHGVGGKPYYTMELLVGESLADRISRKGRLSISEAQTIFAAVADGLTTAHSQGVIHRDLKPGNIFIVCPSEQDLDKINGVKIVDFGIAKIAGSAGGAEQSQTATGVIFGSPLYMSPEQASGLPVDARSDIYSFGCAFFEALTGKPPFKKNNALATIMAHINEPPPALAQARPDVQFPEWLEILMARLLAKRRESRIKSCAEIPHIFAYENKRHAGQTAKDLAEDPAAAETETSPNRTGLKLASIAIALLACIFAGYGLLQIFHGPAKKQPGVAGSMQTARPQAAVSKPPPPERVVSEAAIKALPENFFVGQQKHLGQPCLVYQFGPENVGVFMKGDKDPKISCVNTTYVPQGQGYTFCPGTIFFENPDLFSRFKNGDLDSIRFNSDLALNVRGYSAWPTWSDRHIHAITHLKSLTSVNVGKTSVTEAAIPDLDLLPNLRVLELNECTHFKAARLVDLKNLRQLTDLVISHVDDAPAFLEKAPLDRMGMVFINLKETAITGKHTALLAKLKHLGGIAADITDLTDADLYPLAQLPSLVYFSVSGPHLTPAAVEPLSRLKHVQRLIVGIKGQSAGDRKKLKTTLEHLLPKAAIAIEPFEGDPVNPL